MHIHIHHRRFIALASLGRLRFGIIFDDLVFVTQPLLHRFRVLLVGAIDRFFRCKTPAVEVIAYRMDGYLILHPCRSISSCFIRTWSIGKHRFIQSVRTELVEAFANMLIYIVSISTSSM